MKKTLLILMCVGVSFAASAQLTTGNSTSKNIRTGNRAEAGDFGLYMGTDMKFIRNLANAEVTPTFLPLVNLKYMSSDNLELRVGIDLNKYSQNVKGTEAGIGEEGVSLEVKNKEVESNHSIFPGFAYHFSNLNILDVYAGAELPLGYSRYNLTQVWDGSDAYSKTTKKSFNAGLGAFFGVQAYIANLPFAIGFEYGIYGRLNMGEKFRTETKAGAESDVVVTYNPDASHALKGDFEKLSARTGSIGSELRLTLTYFFKN